jgi:dTMP kinase
VSLFITLEGPEGGGKTTHAKVLAEALKEKGFDVLLTREPGGSAIGDQIRQILMSLENTSMHPSTEFLLFSASRAQHVREIIKPHLDQGGLVVSDRYYHSSLAYQGYGHGLDLDALGHVTRFATADLTPDLILLLDLPVQDGLIRRREEGDWNRLDAYEVEFHQRVREGYLSMAADDPARWLIVDAAAPMDEIQAELQSLVFHRLSNAKRKDQQG